MSTADDFDLGDVYAEPATVETEDMREQAPENVYGDDGDKEKDDGDDREHRPTQRRTPRESTSRLFTALWGLAGAACIHTGFDVPVGRVLQLQAPMAGNIVDDMIKGTIVDTLLQPLMEPVNRVEGVGQLIALPAMVALYERNADLAPAIEPLLRETVSAMLLDLAPELRKRRTRERAAAKTISDMYEDFDIPKGADPVDVVLHDIFKAPVETQEPTQ